MKDILIKKDQQPITLAGEYFLEWKAPEYEHRKKTPDWFWTLGIIVVALFFASILFKNILLGILILIGGFALALYGAKNPSLASFAIGPRGIKINDNVYEYENLKSFWVNYNPPYKKELMIESKKTFMTHVVIPLGDTDPVKVREYLLKFVKEEKIEESLIITVGKLLGL